MESPVEPGNRSQRRQKQSEEEVIYFGISTDRFQDCQS